MRAHGKARQGKARQGGKHEAKRKEPRWQKLEYKIIMN